MSDRSLSAGEAGFDARLREDPELFDLLVDATGEARLYNEWIGERLLQDAANDDEYVAVSFIRASAGGGPRRLDTGEIRIQSDIWVSQTAFEAKDRLEAIDSRMLELIDEVTWLHEGVRLNGIALPERDVIGGHLRPHRRTRDYLVGVN